MIYKKENSTSFALGAFAVHELLERKAGAVKKIFTSKNLKKTRDIEAIFRLAEHYKIGVEDGSKLIERIAGKENVYIMAEFFKFEENFDNGNQIVLFSPSDMGNVGTILRTALGFGYKNIAVIRPCVDVFNPKVVRASQGAIFGLNVRLYDSLNQYMDRNPDIKKYLFMIDRKAETLQKLQPVDGAHALIFGNEAKGLPDVIKKYGTSVFIEHLPEIDSLNLSVSVGMALFKFSEKTV